MMPDKNVQRRVAGYHDVRLDGISDLVLRARGTTVLDVGCNRGLVCFEMANNGARLVHGVDNYEPGIDIARHLFADLRNVESQFECVDLTHGPQSLSALGVQQYQITLILATVHKLRRVMLPEDLEKLLHYIGCRTGEFLGWRATSDKPHENHEEMHLLDSILKPAGLRRIHTSHISRSLGVAAIWARGY